MKKTITLILLGLLCSVGNVWGDDLCSWNLSAVDNDHRTGTVSGTNCSVTYGTLESSSNNVTGTDDNTYWKFGSSTKVQLTLTSGSFQAGDIVTIKVTAKKNKTVGFKLKSTSGNGNTGTTSSTTDYTPLDVSYTLVADDIEDDGSIKIYRNGSDDRFYSFSVSGTRSLAIKTHPTSAVYVSGAGATALTVAASGGTTPYSYQWYSCDDDEKTNATAIDGATSVSYTPSTAATGYYYCKVTDSASPTAASVESNVATITVSAASAPAKPSVSGIPSADGIDKNTSVTLTASSDGIPTPTYAWYTCDANGENLSAEPIATTAAYSPSTSAMGTSYYCVIASNTEGDSQSDAIKVKVNGSNKCEITNIKFSNGAYGAIGTLSDGAATITVPYLSGEPAPSINESSIVISADATKSIDENTIIVTAEDGTTGTYTITKTAFTPLAVTGNVAATDFTDVPSWVYNLYGYDGDKGLKFAKAVDDASNMRIAKGNTRQYYFIGAAKTLTLTKKGTTRKVNVYVNGTKVITDTNNDALGAIALNESAPCMVMIESNQTGGDGGFASYAIAASENVTATVGTAGWATFSSNYQLDFTGKTVNAYIITGVDGNDVVTVSQVYKVPANTGLLLSGTTDDIPVVTGETDNVDGNELVAGNGSLIDGASNKYVLANQAQGVGFYTMEDDLIVPCGKAYLVHGTGGGAPSVIRIVDEENNATSIKAINADNNAVKFIENGTLYILREGVVYDALGRMVR